MQLKFNTIVAGHAFLYTDGYSVKAQSEDGRAAGFPFMSKEHPGREAWVAAVNWARHACGCKTIELGQISDASLMHILRKTDAELA